MADDFDFNVAPAQDEEINMDPRESDNDDISSNDGETDNVPMFGGIEAELMGEDPDSDAESIDSEEAEFRRRVHALISAEAEESGDSEDSAASDSENSGSDSGSEGGELGFGMPPFAHFESGSDSDSDSSSDSDSNSDAEPRLRSRDRRHGIYGSWEGLDDDPDDDRYRPDDASMVSEATDDSWDERVTHVVEEDSIDVLGSEKKIASYHRQIKYRENQAQYKAKLEAEGKKLEFTKFNQLPPELRLRIWELHCPDMQRSHRVLQMSLGPDGHLTTGPTMECQTHRTRQFMRICQETRALGERYMPDTLSIGVSVHDDGILRYNAQKDIIHFMIETSAGLEDVNTYLNKQKDSKTDPNKNSKKKEMRKIASPHTSVRNVAMLDMEIRSRSPGSYFDRIYGRRVIELVLREDASHREPKELRPPGYCEAFDYMFPNVENIYVLEHGAPRKIDRWIGNQRSYERHHIRAVEDTGAYLPEPLEYLYCWHDPPQGFKGRVPLPEIKAPEAKEEQTPAKKDNGEGSSEAPEAETAEAETTEAETAVQSESADNNNNNNNNTEQNKAVPPKEEDKEDNGDFKDDCVINHFSDLRKKGVRFSRMLYFEADASIEDYYRLRQMTCPNGEWPNDSDGQPVQDSLPSFYDERLDYGVDEWDEEDEENDSIVVSDDDEEEDGSSGSDDENDDDDDDVDDLEILGSESLPLEAIFSSPEPESGDEEVEESTKASRGKKRRVVSDSEEDDEDEAEQEAEAGPSRRSKKRRVVESDDDDDDDDDDVVITKSTNRKKPILIDEDDEEDEEDDDDGEEDDEEDEEDEEESSHTEEGDENDSEEEEEEEEHPKKLSLMQMLQQNRKDNPVSDEEASGSDEDGDAGDYAGDYGDGAEDEDEEDDD